MTSEEAMNPQEPTGKITTPTWTDIRRKLGQTDMDYVIGIVKALFDFSKENRTFLASRLFPETDWSALLEKCRKQVREAVFPDPPRQIRLGDARKAISAYKKATSDLAGTAELMLVFVESGTECASSYGVDYESFYNSLISMLNNLLDVLCDEHNRGLLERFRERVYALEEKASDTGWGYADSVSERLAESGLLDDESEGPDDAAVAGTEPDG
ncbi:MAG: hypothetical protein NTX53_06245 [candidate division WOR-3 bacterium]|nr:hypothetical protein [candidate division WOR-3 bacterium]